MAIGPLLKLYLIPLALFILIKLIALGYIFFDFGTLIVQLYCLPMISDFIIVGALVTVKANRGVLNKESVQIIESNFK